MHADRACRCAIALLRSLINKPLLGLAVAIFLGGLAARSAHAGAVILNQERLQASGIATAPLQAATYRAQVEGTATVINPQALATLAAQLATAHAAVKSTEEAVISTGGQARRLRALYSHGKFVSQSDEQVAIAAAAAARAQKISAMAKETSVRASAVATWGAALATIAERSPDAFASYANEHRVLMDIALPVDTTAAPAKVVDILLPSGQTRAASLIGPSPRADAVIQGPTYYYSASGSGLRSGQRLAAEIPVGVTQAHGVVIPDAAVLWYGGEPWAYVETAPAHFVRHLISSDGREAKGWFQRKGFKPGERVVVRGGELLLSQELKPPPGAASAGGDDDD